MPIKELLDEVKAQYGREFESQVILDGKASTMMATAGTVTGLLFGFGTFLVTKIEPTYGLLYVAIISLLAAIITNVFTVFICIRAYYIRDYYFVARDKSFLKKDINSYTAIEVQALKPLNDDRVREYTQMEKCEFERLITRTYIMYTLKNAENNNKKARNVMFAQVSFLVGLVIIPILLAMVLHASSIGAIRLS